MSPAEWIRYAAKGILAGAIAGVGCLATAAVDDGIVLAEWLTAAAAALTAAGGVYGIPNTTKGGEYAARHGSAP